MKDTFDRLRRLLAETLRIDVNRIQPNSTLVGDLGAKSLDIVEVIMALEEEFEIEIPDAEISLQPFKLTPEMTVQDLADQLDG